MIYSADQVLLAELFVEKRTPVGHRPDSHVSEIRPDRHGRPPVLHPQRYRPERHPSEPWSKILWPANLWKAPAPSLSSWPKHSFLSQEKTITRKIKEAILAVQLERRYTKDELLALYLNQIYFGSGAYGVESAARQCFSANPHPRWTYPSAPSSPACPRRRPDIAPLVNPDLAKKRRNLVSKHHAGPRPHYRQPNTVRPPVNRCWTCLTREKHAGSAPYFRAVYQAGAGGGCRPQPALQRRPDGSYHPVPSPSANRRSRPVETGPATPSGEE